ncbi:hypothetical protein TRAPUB_13556 [Trametes pubescens]|uniref:Uncharacterized protein n=1 Tax=Trametes pubescens TaxID=154538 RepID=A0A1M2VQW8_TRAPU|nr:hypothetical protein TRAPUB_13556 [Trametes pubescens]
MSQIEADQLDYLFEKYTYCADYADEEPKPLGEVGASTDVQLEHDRSVHEVLDVIEPPPIEEPSLGPPELLPSSAGTAMSTSLMGRFSLAQFHPSSPSICPSELSSTLELPPSTEVSPAHATGGIAAISDPHPPHTALLGRKRPRTTSSHAVDNRRRQKMRGRDNESDSDSDWEPGVVARRTRSATRAASMRGRAPRGSTKRPVPRGRPQRTSRGREPAVLDGAHGGSAPTYRGMRSVLDHSQHGEARLARVPAAHAQVVSSRQASTEVDSDDTMSPLSDISSSTSLTPPPTVLQYPVTGIEKDDTTLPVIRQDRASKIKARYSMKQGASSDPRAPRRALPVTVLPSDGRHNTVDTELEAEDTRDGATNSDDGDSDYEEDSDFSSPSIHRPLPPRRKTQTHSVQRKRRNPCVGKKKTSRRRPAKGANGELYTYVGPDGKDHEYAHGRADALRLLLQNVHGPIWCLFCTETAPAPEGDSQFSRVKDSPKRHLLNNCQSFKASRYYQRKVRQGMTHERVVEAAVNEKKTAGSIIRCPNDTIQKLRLAKANLAHAEVLYELSRLSTVFKADNCDCCDLPLYSEFRKER